MPFESYPTPESVEALMRSTGYWPTDEAKQDLARLQTQIGAEAAIDEWEHFTGWTPFLASDEFTPRLYDMTEAGGFLELGCGALEVQSVKVGAVALNVNTTYWVHPANAVSQKEPITGLQLNRAIASLVYREPNRIEVVAKWGLVDAVPGDVYQAILQKAALIVLTQIENLQSVASISQDGFTKAYDVVGIVTQKDLVTGVWSKDFEKIAKRWKRVVC